jgi:hypothetical protein
MKDLAIVYFGADRPGANISEALLNSCWNQTMLTGFPAAYCAIMAFSETDMSADLKKIDVPTLILHGDVDQIVPIGNAYRSSKLIPNATLKVYPWGTSRRYLDIRRVRRTKTYFPSVKVGQNQNKRGSILLPDQKLSRLEADALKTP